jgi:hypothetical protein
VQAMTMSRSMVFVLETEKDSSRIGNNEVEDSITALRQIRRRKIYIKSYRCYRILYTKAGTTFSR